MATREITMAAAGASTPVSYWISSLAGSGSGRSVVADSSGNVYVATAYYVIKYNSAGSIVWQTSPTTGYSGLSSIAIDSSGNVFVSGTDGSPGSYSLYVAKLNSSGVVQWERSLSTNTVNYVVVAAGESKIAVGASGNVYVCSSTFLATTSQWGLVLNKFDTNGNVTWSMKLDYASNNYDEGHGISIDSSENIYVSGIVQNGASIVAKYNSSGTLQWQRGCSNSAISGRSCTVDSSGNVYLCLQKSASPSLLIFKYDTSGTFQWQRSLACPNNTYTAMSYDSSGYIYVVIGGAVAKYDGSGTLQWQRSTGLNLYGCYIDSSNNMYLSGAVGTSFSADAKIVKLPNDGTKTGTYGSLVYAVSSYTAATPAESSRTPAATGSSPSYTNTTVSYSWANASLVNSLTNIP